MIPKPNFQPLQSTSKAIFNPMLLWAKYSFISILQANPTYIKPIKLFLTFGMISKSNFQPLESTPKAIFNP